MSTIEPNKTETTGDGLRTDIQQRLKKVHKYVASLVNLVRPSQAAEGAEASAPIHPDAVAICLDALEAQIGQVLEELTRPAQRGEGAPFAADEDETAAATKAAAANAVDPEVTTKRYIAGITLEHIDKIGRLLDSLHALGNVVACADHAELSDITLSIMGDGIYRDVGALRDIMNEIDDNRLEPPLVVHAGVREEEASYLALPTYASPGHTLSIVREHPTYQ